MFRNLVQFNKLILKNVEAVLIFSWIIYLKADVVISRDVQCVKFRWTVRELLCIFSKLKRMRSDSNPYRIIKVGRDCKDHQVQPCPNTTMATKSCCEAPILLFFFSLTLPEMVTPPLSWVAYSKSLFSAEHFGNLFSLNWLKIRENGPRLEWWASIEIYFVIVVIDSLQQQYWNATAKFMLVSLSLLSLSDLWLRVSYSWIILTNWGGSV